MILRPLCKSSVILEYIMYAYTVLYANSINENGETGDFYKLCKVSPTSSDGITEIPYKDYYCPEITYHRIMDEVFATPYILLSGKKKRHLTEYEIYLVQNNVALGCSPYAAKESFLKTHPMFIRYADAVD